jgi:hypothetical protein
MLRFANNVTKEQKDMTRLRLLAATLFVLCLPFASKAQTSIPIFKEADGRYSMEATLNGVGVRTFYTEESWFASVSSTTYLFLTENGYIADSDIKGMTTLKMPGGSSTKAGSFIIRNLRIGNVIVKDLPAFVIAKQTVPLLIGSSTFDCFGEVTIQGDRLLIADAEEVIEPTYDAALSISDSLKLAIQSFLDANEYARAEVAFEELAAIEDLSMFNEYQYICVLNILKKDEAAITHSNDWLAKHGAKALTLDFWVYDALGDAYSRKGMAKDAIDCYEAAVKTYYTMFETDEKAVRKSDRQDETLGYTLYALGCQYASLKNIKRAEQCCTLAAKCGNEAAKSFCEKYRLKY